MADSYHQAKLGCSLPVAIGHQAKCCTLEPHVLTHPEAHDNQAITDCSPKNTAVSDSEWNSDELVSSKGLEVYSTEQVGKDGSAVDIDDSYVMDATDVSTTKILPKKQKRRRKGKQ